MLLFDYLQSGEIYLQLANQNYCGMNCKGDIYICFIECSSLILSMTVVLMCCYAPFKHYNFLWLLSQACVNQILQFPEQSVVCNGHDAQSN